MSSSDNPGHPEERAGPMSGVPRDAGLQAALPFPVVGIGASAGGIEALRAFFTAAPATSGMAYVVIQHLSPDHESLMAEIIGRCTRMSVLPIEDGMSVEVDHVYVIRPGRTITLEGGKLRLGRPVEERGHRHPVDDFFRSLAQDQREKSIAVVLSGTGTNGSAGAQAIKAAGGLCIAQDPDSADFSGMPHSLIAAGCADQVLRPAEIPAVLVRYARQPYVDVDPEGRARAAQELERNREQVADILNSVRVRTGHDFGVYKLTSILRRVQRRMGLAGLRDLTDYGAYLREKSGEITALADDLMINVTGFFRDPEAWEALREAVVRPLVEQRAPGDPIRAWVAACSSGEEPYSLAMLIAEEAERVKKVVDVKIFATDTADKALAFARAGIYPGGIEGDVTPERLERFFDNDEHAYRIKKAIRDQVVFAPQNILRDPPFSRVDIVTCRNLLIYLEPQAQRRVLALMHFALRDGGYLLLGNAETLGHAAELFEVVSKRWRIYRRTGGGRRPVGDLQQIVSQMPEVRPLARVVPATPFGRGSLVASIQADLLGEFAPPTAVVDANERVIYFHGDAEPYLQHPTGEATHELLEVVRPRLRAAVRKVLRQAIAERRPFSIETRALEPGSRTLITVAPLRQHFRVTFERTHDPAGAADAKPAEGGTPGAAIDRPDDAVLEAEVRNLKRELQGAVEAFEATNEELKASNEEVTSINEELQSSNEELETGKEELQALNEELVTVNAQLQSKVLELEALNNDLDNLLSSTDIAVVFLDAQLCVRRFTPAVRDLLELLPADLGRPLAHLAPKFSGGDLITDARQVLSNLVPLESEVLSHSGRWYIRRTLPYRTEDNRIVGLVLTFVDISSRKRAEQAIEAAQARLQAVIEEMPAAVLVADTQGMLSFGNRKAAQLLEHRYPLPFIGQGWLTAFSTFRGLHADGRPYAPAEWPLARALATGEVVVDEEVDFVNPSGTRGTISISAAPIIDVTGRRLAAVATLWDITERKRAEATLRDSEERFRLLVESAHDYAIFMLDLSGNVVSWNRGAERVTGYAEAEILGRTAAILFTPEDRAADQPERELREARAAGRASDERWHVRKDGTRFWASGTVTAARDDRGDLVGCVKIMRDQTERKAIDARLEEAMRSAQQSRATAERANRAKDEFIANVSHELRTPLNTIRLWSRMFVSGKLQPGDVAEGGRAVDRAALAQQQLIDDLLDVSRMATGQLRLAMQVTRLQDAVDGAIEIFLPLAESQQITLTKHFGDDVGAVRADRDRIQQIVWNLLANALKFTPAGGRVHVSMGRKDGTVEIEVADTGIGISAELLPHVFDRFRQGDQGAARRYSGLGLGLAIAKQLAELHGGTITVHSDGDGRGATFTVFLPLERLSAEAGEPTPAVAPEEAPRLDGVDVLLVEDERPAREALGRLLQQQGARVRAAGSAAQAFAIFASRRPNVIVADVGMPDEDGYSLLTRLRRFEEEHGITRVPAVAVTALARSQDRRHALDAGFDEHLPKPVDVVNLITVLRRLLDSASARR